jgi:hypothetical protein
MGTDYYLACEHCVRNALLVSKDDVKGAHVHPDMAHYDADEKIARTTWGGDKQGMMVKFSIPLEALNPATFIVSEYHELTTIGDLADKQGSGVKEAVE